MEDLRRGGPNEVADLLGVNARQVRKWLRTYRTRGLEALCTLHHRGDPGKLRPAPVERLKAEVATGRFLSAQQICDWIDETFHVTYTPRGVRDLLSRIGVSYHKATGFFWKADPVKQEEFIHTYEQQKHEAEGQKTRRYFVDACHPVWGVEMLYYCWLLVGQRFLVGVGGGHTGSSPGPIEPDHQRGSLSHPLDRRLLVGLKDIRYRSRWLL